MSHALSFISRTAKYGSNSPRMSLIKIADSCASSSTNRITPSPECLVSLAAVFSIVTQRERCVTRQRTAASFSLVSRRARYSRLRCSRVTRARHPFPRGFSSKRETARSLGWQKSDYHLECWNRKCSLRIHLPLMRGGCIRRLSKMVNFDT